MATTTTATAPSGILANLDLKNFDLEDLAKIAKFVGKRTALGSLFVPTTMGDATLNNLTDAQISAMIDTPSGKVFAPSSEEIEKFRREEAERLRGTGLVPPRVDVEPLITPRPKPKSPLEDANITVEQPKIDTSNVTPFPEQRGIEDFILTMAKSKISGDFGGTTVNKKGGKSFSDIDQLIKNESVRSVLDKVKTGELSRAQAAKILEDGSGVTNLTAFNKNKNALDARASNFSPIYDAYIKTIPQDDIFLTYPDHIFQTTGKKLQSSEIKKVGELDKIFKRVNSEEFLNIKLPDGTTMKDQPLDYQYYNAYIDSVPRQDHAAYSEFAKKYLNDFYKFRKSKEFNFRKPVKYDEVEGTGYIYDTRVGDKMSKAMSSEFKPLYDTLRKKVQSNVVDIPAANQIRVGIPGVLNNHLTRMINRAELEGASFDEIAEVINNIDAKAISDLFTRKFLLENKIRALKTESLSSSLKQTDPQLFPESIPKLKEMNTGLIEISHIEDVVDNWRASFDINNLFLASGKFNRDQRKIDIRLNTILGKLDNIKPDSNEAKELLKEMANLEQSLVDKNLISKIGDRYFGVSKDTDFEKAILDKTQKAVDMTRFYNKGGIVSIEEMIQPINAQR